MSPNTAEYRIIAWIEYPVTIKAILTHLGLPARGPYLKRWSKKSLTSCAPRQPNEFAPKYGVDATSKALVTGTVVGCNSTLVLARCRGIPTAGPFGP
jgi:hypothetical protein